MLITILFSIFKNVFISYYVWDVWCRSYFSVKNATSLMKNMICWQDIPLSSHNDIKISNFAQGQIRPKTYHLLWHNNKFSIKNIIKLSFWVLLGKSTNDNQKSNFKTFFLTTKQKNKNVIDIIYIAQWLFNIERLWGLLARGGRAVN